MMAVYNAKRPKVESSQVSWGPSACGVPGGEIESGGGQDGGDEEKSGAEKYVFGI